MMLLTFEQLQSVLDDTLQVTQASYRQDCLLTNTLYPDTLVLIDDVLEDATFEFTYE
jgi:hypothetical protein